MANVLIVDDDLTIIHLLVDLVAEHGHTAVSATNGLEALERARAMPPALIISDVMMPVMDGYGLLAAVRNEPTLQHTLIFLMSAAFLPQQPLHADPPPDGYIPKPFDLSVLEGLIQRLPPDEPTNHTPQLPPNPATNAG